MVHSPASRNCDVDVKAKVRHRKSGSLVPDGTSTATHVEHEASATADFFDFFFFLSSPISSR